MGDLTRRQFIGRTLITGATIAAGGLSTISTTPVKVVPKTMVWKNLNVLTPKAKAYRSFLRGAVGMTVSKTHTRTATKGALKSLITRSADPAVVLGSKSANASEGKNVGRRAFGKATQKPEASHVRMEAKQGVGNTGAREIANKIYPNPELKKAYSKRNFKSDVKHSYNQRAITARLDKSARTELAKELRAQRVNIQATKTTSTTSKGGGKSGGGGGGKFGGNTFGRHSPWSLLRNDKNF